MTSIDEIVRELRAIAGHAGHDFDAVERKTIDQAASVLARSRRMEEALREIADHWACAYDHKYANTEAYRGSYGIGIVDGHRAAALIAKAALEGNGG